MLLRSPLDLVKTLLQGQSGAPGTRAYAGPIDCFKKVVAKNGAWQHGCVNACVLARWVVCGARHGGDAAAWLLCAA
ncbi:hypothetical protein EON67_05475 [archaeon]|nr:MAG: hypothetical protein EON67_05475 [archaeon]